MSKSKKNANARAAAARAAAAEVARAERKRNLFIAGGVALAIALIIGAGVWIQSSRDTTGDTSAPPVAASPSGTATDAAIPGPDLKDKLTADYGIVVGKADAPTTLTIYEDFQCPICQQLEAVTGDAVTKAVADGKVKVDYRMVSFLDHASENEYSSRALNVAWAVFATEGADAFAKFHKYLYEHQPPEGTAGPENAQLLAAAVQQGADAEKLQFAVDTKQYEQDIVNATDAMSKNKVTGTPTVFINGQLAGDNPQAAAEAILAVTQ